ncbi:MAG TPA: DUF2298 domain-containing protein [Chloroflexia bacterium]|nr:DUF2298 domain-containing protein [Chloroflexia bacterium]
MGEAILWLLLVELIGLAALPLAFSVFRFLPERGYTLGKPLGLLITAYAVWLLSMLGLPFNPALCWVVFGLLFIVLDCWLLLRQGGKLRREIFNFVATHAWLIVLVEIVFILAYAYLLNMRSYYPEIRDYEKFGDYAFLNSLSTFDKMPPADPWMSGYPINYYYFSHFMMAMLVKMTGIAPNIAFNLTIPLIFAMTGLACFGIVYNLVAVARRGVSISPKAVKVAALVGLLGLVMVCILGNLDPVRQIFFPRPDKGETGISNFVFSWWTPSRVIYDYMPDNSNGFITFHWSETINEFPMFSFLIADMHPHVMTLPTTLLAIALAFNMLLTPARAETLNLRRGDGWLFFGIAAVVIGGLYFLNTWDYPTYLILFVLAAFLRTRLHSRQEGAVRGLGPLASRTFGPYWRWAGYSVALAGVSLALYLPFHLTFVSLVGDFVVPEPIASIPVVGSLARIISFVAWDRTPLLGYLLVFGIFIFPLVSLLLLKLWPYLKQPYAYLDDPDYHEPEKSALPSWGYNLAIAGVLLVLVSEILFFLLHTNPVLTIGLGLLAIPLLAIGVVLLTLDLLEKYREDRPRNELLLVTGAVASLMIMGGWVLHFELYGPLIIAGTGLGLLLWFETRPEPLEAYAQQAETGDKPDSEVEESASLTASASSFNLKLADRFALLLAFLPVVINFGTELIIIRDVFNARLNTLFKFYYQSWVMFGLAAAYAVWRFVAWAWKQAPFDETGQESVEETATTLQKSYRPGSTKPQTQPQVSLRLSPAGGLAGGGLLSGNWAFSTGLRSSEPPGYVPAGNTPQESQFYVFDDTELDDLEAEEAEEYQLARPKRPWWRWLWLLGLSLLFLGGMVYPIFGPYEKTVHYAKRVGLDGEAWMRDGGLTGGGMPQDYQAIQWLKSQIKANPKFSGTILEASGPDWVDYSRISTFTAMPTLLGWIGHEDQWRAGKANARTDTFDCGQTLAKYGLRPPQNGASLQKNEPYCRLQLIDFLYSTTDVQKAQDLLKAAGVKYVYVGSIETGASSGRASQPKAYSPEALAKFGQFMKVIYQQNGVTIYSF